MTTMIGPLSRAMQVAAERPAVNCGELRLTYAETWDRCRRLAGALRGIVCQRLVPSVDGGLVPVHEILINTGRIAERIAQPDRTSEIHEIIADGSYYGMVTFDQSLVALVSSGQVDAAAALETSSSPHDFQLMLHQAGLAVPATA